jgi:hypothetical protein
MKINNSKKYTVFMIIGILLFVPSLIQAQSQSWSHSNIVEKAARLHIPFIANQGQMDKRVAFYAKTFGATVFVTKEGEIIYSLPKAKNEEKNFEAWEMKEELVGGMIGAVKAEEKSATHVSFLIGNAPSLWRDNIPTFEYVSFGEVYKGIELKLKAYGNNVEKLFYVTPGHSPEQIQMKFNGGKTLKINAKEELEVATDLGTVTFSRPMAYQEIDGKKIEVPVRYALLCSEVKNQSNELIYGFTLGPYDRSKGLVIDPILQSTYLGGGSEESAASVTTDVSGNVYLTGSTPSTHFPGTSGGIQPAHGGGTFDVFVVKLNSSLTAILQATYLGGSDNDYANSMVLDDSGNVYITGSTFSVDFPGTAGGVQPYKETGSDSFVTKLSPNLTSILQSTYLGGNAPDVAFSIAIGPAGNVYIGGHTSSANIPGAIGGAQPVFVGGYRDAFVAKFNPALTALLQFTYLGGWGDDFIYSIIIDKTGNVYGIGLTGSSSFPNTAGGAQSTYKGGTWDGFVTKFNPTLTTILQSTYLGGSGDDFVHSATLDSSGNLYVVGCATPDFPGTAGGAQPVYGGGPTDAVVTKLNPDLTSILQSTYLGGSDYDFAFSIVPDTAGNVYVAGRTTSTDFPGTSGGAQSVHGGSWDVFVTKLDSSLTSIIQSTYLGGNGEDNSVSLCRNSLGHIYVVGVTTSSNFPLSPGSPGASCIGAGGAFVTKLDSTLTDKFTLAVSKTGAGSGTIVSSSSGINCGTDCSEFYTAGSSVTLIATPDVGSTFTGWSGACSGADATCTVVMDADKNVTANFEPSMSSSPIPLPFLDEFNVQLSTYWQVANEDSSKYSLTESPGNLRIYTTNTDIFGNNNSIKNLFTVQLPENIQSYVMTAKVRFPITPSSSHQQGGIAFFGNNNGTPDLDNYIRFGYGGIDGVGKVETCYDINGVPTSIKNGSLPIGQNPIWLKIEKAENAYTTYYSLDGENYVKYFGPFTQNWDIIYAGIYAFNGDTNAPSIPVDFDYFAVTSLSVPNDSVQVIVDTVTMQGQHIDGFGSIGGGQNNPTPYTGSTANGTSILAIANYAGNGFSLVSGYELKPILKDTTYWVNAKTHELVNTESTPGITKINFMYEPIELIVDTVNMQGQHIDGLGLIGGGQNYSTPYAGNTADGAYTLAIANYAGNGFSLVSGYELKPILKDTTYWVNAKTHELVNTESTPGITKINFMYEPIELIVDTVNMQGQHIDGLGLIGGGQNYSTPYIGNTTDGAYTLAIANYSGLVSGFELNPTLKDTTYWVNVNTHQLVNTESTPGITKINFMYGPTASGEIQLIVDTVDQQEQHIDGQVVTQTGLQNSPVTLWTINGSTNFIPANPLNIPGQGALGSTFSIEAIAKDTTYWFDARTKQIVRTESTPGVNKINFMYETMNINVDTVDQQEQHISGQVVTQTGLQNSPATLWTINGSTNFIPANPLNIPGQGALGSTFSIEAIAKDTTYWFDARTKQIVRTESTPGVNKINFMYETMNITVDTVDQQEQHISGQVVTQTGLQNSPVTLWTINGSTNFIVALSIVNSGPGSTFSIEAIAKDTTYWFNTITQQIVRTEITPGNNKVNFIFNANQPVAQIISDQSVHIGSVVTLDGSGSSDPDGNYPLTYAWGISSKPKGSNAMLSNATALNPSFNADLLGYYTINLVVTDSIGLSSESATVTISAVNAAPVAEAGADQAITSLNTQVQLNGSQSYDADGDSITYSWIILSRPENSLAELSGSDGAHPFFTADKAGDYVIQLVVNDPWTNSEPDTVTIQVTGNPSNPALNLTLQKAPQAPLAGLMTYLFNSGGIYLDSSVMSDTNGLVCFTLTEGAYKVRVDYLGYQFWTDLINVTQNTSQTLTIPHQDVNIKVQGQYGTPEPLSGLNVYLFTPGNTYLGQFQNTDQQGLAHFNLPPKDYKVRIDYLSQQYWSNTFNGQDQTITINQGLAQITVTQNALPLQEIHVYAFTPQGAYLGLTASTDAQGQVAFKLPEGQYKFRADYLGSQYWSTVSTVIAHTVNPITLSTGGGSFTLTVNKAENTPLVGMSCYLFDAAGSYLGQQAVTNDQGQVGFNLSNGDYKIRVDYLGYQFWTDPFTIPNTSQLTQTIPHQDIGIQVQTSYNNVPEPKSGLYVYLFTPDNSYLGQYQITDSQGFAHFNLLQQEYKVRVDYLGQQYWSETFNGTNPTVTITQGLAEVHVTQLGTALANTYVYLFSETNSYLGLYGLTDSQGITSFQIPAGNYKFRADFQGGQYWASAAIQADQINVVNLSTGGGTFILNIVKAEGQPLANVPVYAFSSSGSYLGLSSQTNSLGQVQFNIADGQYKFRTDYLGYQFWSNVEIVPNNLIDTLLIPHQDVTLTVSQNFQQVKDPLQNVRAYLFKSSGSYMGIYADTNTLGQVSFNLPQQEYKVRADYLGYQFWSEPFTWLNKEVELEHGKARVHVTQGGQNIANAKVYLFLPNGSYLGRYQTTDGIGLAEFLLPNQAYKFRVDYSGQQYWSSEVTVIPHEEHDIEVNLE